MLGILPGVHPASESQSKVPEWEKISKKGLKIYGVPNNVVTHYLGNLQETQNYKIFQISIKKKKKLYLKSFMYEKI